MRRTWGAILLALVLVTGGVVLSAASAGGDKGRNGAIWLVAKSVEEVEVDTDGSGDFSLGDQVIFTDDLYLKKQKVGTLEGTCIVQRITEPAVHIQCLVTAVVDGVGQIAHQGVIPLTESGLPDRFYLPITGGSGDFVGATGQTKIRPLSETKVLLKVMLLELDD